MFAGVIGVVLFFFAATTRVQVGDKPIDIELDCDSLSDVIVCDNPAPKALGSGVFGQAWLVKPKVPIVGTEAAGGMMVMKTFLNKRTYPDGFLIQADFHNRHPKYKDMVKAKEECEMAQYIHKDDGRLGWDRLARCFGHNVEEGGGQMPLYTLMDYCGSRELFDFANKELMDLENPLEIIKSIFKQLLEGLDYLATLSPPVSHHDLKSSNVVIRTSTGKDGKNIYTAHIIDYGGAVLATEENQCKKDGEWTLTPIVSPAEIDNRALCGGSLKHMPMFDLNVPGAFDMYSLANIWFDMLTGLVIGDLVHRTQQLWCYNVKQHWCKIDSRYTVLAGLSTPNTQPDPFMFDKKHIEKRKRDAQTLRQKCVEEWNECGKEVLKEHGFVAHWDQFTKFLNHEFFFLGIVGFTEVFSPVEEMREKRATFLREMLERPDVVRFTKYVMEALAVDPKDRPTAKEMLEHEFMAGVKEPELDTAKDDVAIVEEIAHEAVEAAARQETLETEEKEYVLVNVNPSLWEASSSVDDDNGERKADSFYLTEALRLARQGGTTLLGMMNYFLNY